LTSGILDGLPLVDATGRLILTMTLGALALGVVVNLIARTRYARLEADLDENGATSGRFVHALLNDITRRADEAFKASPEPNTQAIVEECVQSDLRTLLLAERFARAATGLVIILGLLGTFYGLTSSIGRLVQLVGGDAGTATGVAESVTTGLTQALSGMVVAFSNSLVGVGSAVVLTVLGVLSNITDRRVALMIRIEAYLDRRFAGSASGSARGHRGEAIERSVDALGQTVERLDGVVARFDAALQAFSTSTREFSEFNAHLKDNVQRMSLTFGDLNETLKQEIVTLKRDGGH
jgi:hypothetical protein